MPEITADNTATISVTLGASADLTASISGMESTIEADVGITAEYANRAGKLAEERKIALTGQASGEALFDGSADISIYTAIERLTNEELEDLLA